MKAGRAATALSRFSVSPCWSHPSCEQQTLSEGICPGEWEAGSIGNSGSFKATAAKLNPGIPESDSCLLHPVSRLSKVIVLFYSPFPRPLPQGFLPRNPHQRWRRAERSTRDLQAVNTQMLA